MKDGALLSTVRSVGHLAACFAGNCSEFKRQWQSYQAEPLEAPLLRGRWEGEWVSEGSGHRGRLRCVLSSSGASRCRAWFHANYSKVLRVCYQVELDVRQEEEGKLLVGGNVDLGRLAGGVYQYEGRIQEEEFRCSYKNAYDHGYFRLCRVD